LRLCAFAPLRSLRILHSMRFCRPQDALNLFIRYLRSAKSRETQRHRDHRVKCSGSLCGLCASVFQFLCMVGCNQNHLELNLGSFTSRLLWPDPRVRD
jgi:hypothetical protein